MTFVSILVTFALSFFGSQAANMVTSALKKRK